MKIEEAKAELARTALLMFEHDGTSTLDGDATLRLIDKIYAEMNQCTCCNATVESTSGQGATSASPHRQLYYWANGYFYRLKENK